jgi:hypothetical protein
MKRPSVGGFTAAGVLVVAIMGGAVGGALVMSGQAAPVAPSSSVTLHQVADEATPEPSAAPVVDEDPAPAPMVVHPAPVPVVASGGGSGETASEAADRAATEADRAETAADRAENTTAPKPAPVVAPVVAVEEEPVAKPTTPAAPAPECQPGQTRGVPARAGEYQITYGCVNGKWVETDRRIATPPQKPAPVQPAVVESPPKS